MKAWVAAKRISGNACARDREHENRKCLQALQPCGGQSECRHPEGNQRQCSKEVQVRAALTRRGPNMKRKVKQSADQSDEEPRGTAVCGAFVKHFARQADGAGRVGGDGKAGEGGRYGHRFSLAQGPLLRERLSRPSRILAGYPLLPVAPCSNH